MKLRSSINIELVSYFMLIRACKAQNTTVPKMIALILKDSVLKYDITKDVPLFRTVKYQPKGLEYKIVHFYLEREEYESCIDFRKFGKVSVSSVLNAWIKKYFGNTVKSKNNEDFNTICLKLDNYTLQYQIDINKNDRNNGLMITINRTWLELRKIQQ
ncbi:MAG TPA: hypothetical protein PLE16_01295 [Spirochaetota bacterium]|nr:hypothetical protein [Spirochaetota bacterium]HOH36459.1 hypothetical protein [Spirochaetota bacterium]HPJ13866.1 hypothetical protein [Spirochaetota bacterium]HPM33213.1 hypothetical protein [Spirochaetota bacterium]HPW51388.1 hypothetical protein [Spirochaetota bacterium]